MNDFSNDSNPLLIPHETLRPFAGHRYFKTAAALEVEIGFGLGEFLTRKAQEEPQKNFLGIEIDGQRFKKALRRLVRENVVNVKIIQLDAWVVFERFLSPCSVEQAYSLFPCPWPKKGHAKHRLFSREFLKLVNSRLVEKGEFKIVTDHYPYRDWIMEQVSDTGFKIQTKDVKTQFDTKFERKWREAGRESFCELRLQKIRHTPMPFLKDAALSPLKSKHFDPQKFSFVHRKILPVILFKDFLFDASQQKALVLLLVIEKYLRQRFWIEIVRIEESWIIRPSEGNAVLPTPALALALELVRAACEGSSPAKGGAGLP